MGDLISVESELSDNQTDAYVVDKIGVPFNNPHEPRCELVPLTFLRTERLRRYVPGTAMSGLFPISMKNWTRYPETIRHRTS